MKKLIVIALAVVMALSVVAFAACGGAQTVEGEYSYKNAWDKTGTQSYGAKVTVTVKGGVITSVEVAADTDTFFNLSSGWTDKSKWENGEKAMIDSFVGLTVKEVKAIKVTCDTETNSEAHTVKGQPTKIEGAPANLKVVSGATQSSGRLILAVQDALEHLA